MHVIDAHPPYHVLLGLPWIHSHRAVPSTYFQCIKALIRAVPVHIDAVSLPFEEHETYFMDASFYGRKKDEEMLEQEEKDKGEKEPLRLKSVVVSNSGKRGVRESRKGWNPGMTAT